MIFLNNQKIHPNIPKHIAELLGEEILPPDVLDKLRVTNFFKEDNGMVALQNFLKDKVSDNVCIDLMKKVNGYIFNSKDPLNILLDYIQSAPVRKNIKASISKFNNNKNYTYDLDAILVHFRNFCSKSSIHNYDLNSNGLAGYLTHTYSAMYAMSNTEFITSILNAKGSLVDTEDGSVSLEQLISVKEEKRTASIDFTKVVKNIYEGSQVLFEITGEVRYNIFSYFLSEELDDLELEIKNYLNKTFSNKYSPNLVVQKKNYGYKGYHIETVTFRLELLNHMIVASKNGLTLKTLRELFKTIVMRDYNKQSKNIGKLFVHTVTSGLSSNSNKKTNERKFLDILRGINSAKELQTYLNETGQKLYEEDCSLLFETPFYYKRFTTMEDYFLLRDLTSDLVDKTKDLNYMCDEIPYDTNDGAFKTLERIADFNFSSLKDYMKLNLTVSKSFDVNGTIKYLLSLGNNILEFHSIASAIYNKVLEKLPDFDPSSPEIYDLILSKSGKYSVIMTDVIFQYSPIEQRELKEVKDPRVVLRYCNFTIVLITHFVKMLKKSRLDLDECLLSIEAPQIFLPDSVDTANIQEFVKFDSPIALEFYLRGDEKVSDSPIRYQYSLFYLDFLRRIEDAHVYLKDWANKIEKSADDINLKFNNVKLTEKLKLISLDIMRMEDNNSKALSVFVSNKQVVDGFVFVNGEIYRNKYGYIHERGYFVNPNLNYDISKIEKGVEF